MKKWLLSAALMATATTSYGQCAPHLPVAQGLAERYQEGVVARGLQNDGMMVELYLNADSGTFSVILVSPEGLACLVSSGEAMSLIDGALAPSGDES